MGTRIERSKLQRQLLLVLIESLIVRSIDERSRSRLHREGRNQQLHQRRSHMKLRSCEKVAEKGDFGSCFRVRFHRTRDIFCKLDEKAGLYLVYLIHSNI